MNTSPYHLFHGYGIELEYMLVDKDSLIVRPIADDLLKYELGEIGSDFTNGMVTWSNELVLHVIEIKSTQPESDLEALEKAFNRNISRINTILEEWNAMLMPSAAHPFMNPFKETKLWPHDNNEVYELYNKIFDCSGHGWSNLQSTHLNLPFSGDVEFAKLHAAVRMILPLLPVCAPVHPSWTVNFQVCMIHDCFTIKPINQKFLPSQATLSQRQHFRMMNIKIPSIHLSRKILLLTMGKTFLIRCG